MKKNTSSTQDNASEALKKIYSKEPILEIHVLTKYGNLAGVEKIIDSYILPFVKKPPTYDNKSQYDAIKLDTTIAFNIAILNKANNIANLWLNKTPYLFNLDKLLIYAIKQQSFTISDSLIEHGAEITPDVVRAAIYNDSLESLHYLIDKGANIQTSKDGDDYALLYAAHQSSLNIVKYFIIDLQHDINIIIDSPHTTKDILTWAKEYKQITTLKNNLEDNLNKNELSSSKKSKI